MIDDTRLDAAKLSALTDMQATGGVGTLSEKYVHKMLKYAIDPDSSHHEVKHLGCIADIMNENGITEIQTRAFERLVSKLGKFLPTERVTLVCPMAYEKRICLIDGVSGEITYRKSPRRRGIFDAAIELYKIREHLFSKNLTVVILLLGVDEYARDTLRGKRRKREKLNAVPTSVIDTVTLASPDDYRVFLPEGLPLEFLAKDYYKLIGSRTRYSYNALKLCEYMGFVSVTSKRGNAFVYRLNEAKKQQ